MEKQKFTWEQFDQAVEYLCKQIIESDNIYIGVYGIPRGGLPLAVALSHRLDLDYVSEEKAHNNRSHILVVDDISDSGKTLHKFRKNHIATIHKTNNTITPPTYYYDIKEKAWIVYPWGES